MTEHDEHDEGHDLMPRTRRLDQAALTWLEWMLVATMFIVFAMMGVLWNQMVQLEEIQNEDRAAGIANRVVSCRVLVALGIEMTDNGPCSEVMKQGLFVPDEVTREVTEKELLLIVCGLHERLDGLFSNSPPPLPAECESKG